MKNISRIISVALLIVALIAGGTLYAAKSKTVSSPKLSEAKENAICLPPSSDAEITINNVRAYIQTDGTMWSTEIARYEIPKGSGKMSMFCAALWIGGTDRNGQVRLAAMRFGQIGNDYWTGPLDTRTATVDQTTCVKYDKLFKITRAEVVAHKEAFRNNDPTYSTPASIKNWPGNGDFEGKGQSFFLAPYFDQNGDGVYTPEQGDYPYYDLDNELCPWTIANRQRAAAHELPYPPEELDTRIPHASGEHWSAGHMVYADHVLKGDETLFWIFNDMGGAHTETGGPNIGLEIRGQVFGFATNDEINNMTFYSYEIINRSTRDLTNTYFSQWVDPDLGYENDDYVGCDVLRGLGYCYNGIPVDGTGQLKAYGDQPPAVGVDFFQGPYIDPDGRDNPKFYKDSANTAYCTRFLNDPVDQMGINGVNFGDTIVDNERFGMRRFVYHDNNSSPTGDPSIYMDYYNMLQGYWKDNSRMRYGGNGHKDNGGIGPECDFMFPGTTDPCNWGTRGEDIPAQYKNAVGWTEEAEGNAAFDRRFMQSAGPFTLNAGAVNYITVGIPWARAAQGGPWASVELLKRADDVCQALFENCFKVLDGPDAPEVTIRELENEVVLYLTNDIPSPTRNNFNETYEEVDPTIPMELVVSEFVTDTILTPIIDTNATPIVLLGYDTLYNLRQVTNRIQLSEQERSYKFEGYMIYQLAGKDVSVTELDNPSKAKLVKQCDIKNQYAQLINWEYNEQLATSVPIEKVNGSNTGISHSFSITEDKFTTTGSTKLVNHKTYYYMVIAYAVNEYKHFSIDLNSDNGLLGQKKVFLAGRNNIQVYSAIPHKPAPQEQGTILNCGYGTQPMITRIEGQGNGGFFLDLTDETRDKILAGGDNYTWKTQQLTYKNNAGPLAIKVIDPIKVQPFDYRIKFIDSVAVATGGDLSDTTTWILEVLDITLEQAKELDEDYEKFWANGVLTLPSSVAISVRNEQLFLPLGISISIENRQFQIYQDEVVETIKTNRSYKNLSMYGQVDFIDATITYKDSTHQWLSGLVDMSGDFPANWIRSGTSANGMWEDFSPGQDGACDEYAKWRTEDAHYSMSYQGEGRTTNIIRTWKDPNAQFSKVVGGTWSPYVLASPFFGGPQARYIVPDGAFSQPVATTEPVNSYYNLHLTSNGAPALGMNTNNPGFNQTMTNLYSVDVVLTPNKDLWTRCVVLESCDDATKSVGNAKAHEPRKQASVGKDGQPDNTGNGMGWFPGYAINVETGERLNIMFAENSSDVENNGNDMLFNPTNVYAYYNQDPGTGSEFDIETPILRAEDYNNLYEQGGREPNLKLVNGGKHYLYICGSSGNTASTFYRTGSQGAQKRNYNDKDIVTPSPGGISSGGTLNGDGVTPFYECGPYDEGKWLMTKFNTFVSDAASPSQAQKNYKMQLFNNVMWTSIPMATPKETWVLDDKTGNDVTIKIRVSRPYMRYTSRWHENYMGDDYSKENYGLPLYSFTTKNIAPTFNVTDISQSILDGINIVPNPYYGFSQYETSSLETAVKIVNLPEICDISIYTVNGILVKRISKGDKGSTLVTWDLKNDAGIPISSGMYVIYVKAPNIGERTLKFFAAMRPTDYNSF